MRAMSKEQVLARIERRSLREAARLAGEFARAASQDREAALDAMELEKWVAESCQVCLPQGPGERRLGS